jgi:excisionase family DNA binding protein
MRHRGLGDVSELKPPGYYVTGNHGPGVEIPGRVAAWLESHLDLRRVRTDARGLDVEVDSVLADLHRVALVWRASATGSATTPPPEATPLLGWMSTTQAASLLKITDRAVRLAIQEHRLPAQQLAGRWRITREDVEHYRAARAA